MSSGHRSSPKSSRAAETTEPTGPLDRCLLSVVDWGLAGVVVVSPLFMGGRHPLGELVIVALSLLIAVAWLGRGLLTTNKVRWTPSGADLILCLAALLVVAQLIPWPQSVLRLLSPHTAQVLPLWTAELRAATGLGEWRQVSMTPRATGAALIMFCAYAMLFCVAVQRLERLRDVERLLGLVAISATFMAVLGIAQYLTSNGKFLWIYEHPYRDTNGAVMGPFVNKNHFAHLLALGLGPLIWAVQRAIHRQSKASDGGFGAAQATAKSQWITIGLVLALGTVLFAGLMTISRGGIVALLVAGAVCIGVMQRSALLGKKVTLTLIGVGVLIAVSLGIHGYRQVAQRMDDYASGSIEDLDTEGGRRKIWEADWNGVKDYYVLGTGVGSHRDVYPMYFTSPWPFAFSHAECGYLQVALEAGAPGVVLLLSAIGLAGYWCVRGLRSSSKRVLLATAAVAAGLVASVVHSTADFVWYISSCMAVTTLLLACAFRLKSLAAETDGRAPARSFCIPRGVLGLAGAAVIALGVWMVGDRLGAALAAPHWDRYLAYRIKHGAEAYPQEIVEHLEECGRLYPHDSHVQLELAKRTLRTFDEKLPEMPNQMPLGQICDAALKSNYPSRAALDDWLSKAVGEPRHLLEKALRHTHLALQLCPLEGEAYYYLTELCFLQGAQPAAKARYLAQALKTRPHSGVVLLGEGSETILAGDFDRGLAMWRDALRADPEIRAMLVGPLVALQIPPDFVITALEPDLPSLREINTGYLQAFGQKAIVPLSRRYADLCVADAQKRTGTQAMRVYLEAHRQYAAIGDHAQARATADQALTADPGAFEAHHTIGLYWISVGELDRAEEQLRWCNQRQPADVSVSQALERVVKGRLSRQAQAGSPENQSFRRQ